MKPRIQTPSTSFSPLYPFAVELADKQLDLFWVAKDYNIADDMQDFRTKCTKAERMMIIQTQAIFNHYEVRLGTDFWNGRFKKIFPRYEFERMGSVFGMMETAVHAPFYVQMIDALGFNTEDFHNKAFNDPELSQRLDFVVKALNGKCDLRALAAMCFLEGTALFSSLAALMSFRKPGASNLMKNMVSGIVHSCQDELLHCTGSAIAFKALLEEKNLTPKKLGELYRDIKIIAEDLVQHEKLLIAKLFEGGELRNINPEELLIFVIQRSEECLELLGVPVHRVVTESSISRWLYVMVQSYSFGDFFQTSQKDYNKSVAKERFTW